MKTPNFYANGIHTFFEDFLNKSLTVASINYLYNFDVQNTEKMISALENRKGSILDDGTIDYQISALVSDLAKLEENHKTALKDADKWKKGDAEKAFAKKVDSANGNDTIISSAIVEWWATRGIECPYEYAHATIRKVGKNKDVTGRKMVESACKGDNVAMSELKKGDAFMKSAIKVWATDAIECGSVKAQAMSDAVQRAYKANLAEAEARKEAKKAKKSKKNNK